MLFKIKAVQTVQLGAADFHKRYKDAVEIKLKQQIQSKIDTRLGRILYVKVEKD